MMTRSDQAYTVEEWEQSTGARSVAHQESNAVEEDDSLSSGWNRKTDWVTPQDSLLQTPAV